MSAFFSILFNTVFVLALCVLPFVGLAYIWDLFPTEFTYRLFETDGLALAASLVAYARTTKTTPKKKETLAHDQAPREQANR